MTATPNYIVTTGDFISEWMEDAGINAAELARRLDVTPKHVSELLSGKAPLSAHLALALERVTGVPARLWNMYEAGYREDLARQQAVGDLDAQYEQAKAFPLGYLRKFGFIKASARDQAGTVRELLTLLGVASFDAWPATWTHGSVAYRRIAAGRDDAPALSVWLTIAERGADPDSLGPYDDAALREYVPRIRALTVGDPASSVAEAARLLREVGVALCFVPAVPGLGIHGATRWVNGHPVIQLSLLWKCDDQLWFTLFHELGTCSCIAARNCSCSASTPPLSRRLMPTRHGYLSLTSTSRDCLVSATSRLSRLSRLNSASRRVSCSARPSTRLATTPGGTLSGGRATSPLDPGAPVAAVLAHRAWLAAGGPGSSSSVLPLKAHRLRRSP